MASTMAGMIANFVHLRGTRASRYGDGPFRAFTWSARARDAA